MYLDGIFEMFEFIKKIFKKKQTAKSMRNSPEPWVNVVQAHLAPDNPKQGYFELEWNPAFVVFLQRGGYQGATAEEIVDQWFTDMCRNVSMDSDAASSFVADAGRMQTNNRTRNQ
jgi:hypothetical protein